MVTGFVKQCYSDKQSLTPHKYLVCVEVIFGLSQHLYDKTIRVSRGCKSKNPDLGEHSNMLAKTDPHKSPSPQALTLNHTAYNNYASKHKVTKTCNFHPFL